MDDSGISLEELDAIKLEIRKLSEFNLTSVQGIVLHFQALKSGGASRIMMDAPGLYYPRLPLYIISKSGMARGHSSVKNSIQHLLPESKGEVYGFVLYPESYVRTCLDRVLRKTVKVVSPDMRIGFENNFNKKYHNRDLNDSEVLKELIMLLQHDLAIVSTRKTSQL